MPQQKSTKPEIEQVRVRKNGRSDRQKKQNTGLALAAMILGLVSLVGFCCGLNIITGPIAIGLGIAALVKRQNAVIAASTGIVTGLASLIVLFSLLLAFKELLPYRTQIIEDYGLLTEQEDEIFAAYADDGTLPDFLMKYTEPPYSDFLEKYDATFYDIMDALLARYEQGQHVEVNVNLPDSTEQTAAAPA